jgi:hypothetical protein
MTRYTIAAVLALAVLCLGAFVVLRARTQRQVASAKVFCESLVPRLQQIHAETGAFPKKVDPAWWGSQAVPPLIRTQDFYFSNGKTFILHFRDPSAFWDDIWGFDSRWMTWGDFD